MKKSKRNLPINSKNIVLLLLKIVGIFVVLAFVSILIFISYFKIKAYKDSQIEKQIDLKFHQEVVQIPQMKIKSFKLWEGDSIVEAEIENKGSVMFWYGKDGVPRIERIGSYSTSYDCFYVNDKGEKKSYAFTTGLVLDSNSNFGKWFPFKVHNLKDLAEKYDSIVQVLDRFPKNPAEVNFKDNWGERQVLKESDLEYTLTQELHGKKVQCDLFSRL